MAYFWSIRMENQGLWSKDKTGDAKWVQYLCRLGFSVDFVHRLGAGIDSMGKLLFHVLIGLSYFPNAKERITDCISICSKQEISPDWISHFNTHLSNKPGSWQGHSLWQSRAVLLREQPHWECTGKETQLSLAQHVQFCTQTGISLKYNLDVLVWPEWCERQLHL